MAAEEFVSTYLTSPMDDSIPKLRGLVDYFHYKAPGISSATAAPRIDDEKLADRLWHQMMKEAGLTDTNTFVCSRRRKKLSSEEMEMAVFSHRYVWCQKGDKERELDSVLRHLRNAMAHGHLYVKQLPRDTQICLLDYESGRISKPSAKLVLNRATLERWRRILRNAS